jgi:hypothetical protein
MPFIEMRVHIDKGGKKQAAARVYVSFRWSLNDGVPINAQIRSDQIPLLSQQTRWHSDVLEGVTLAAGQGAIFH